MNEDISIRGYFIMVRRWGIKIKKKMLRIRSRGYYKTSIVLGVGGGGAGVF